MSNDFDRAISEAIFQKMEHVKNDLIEKHSSEIKRELRTALNGIVLELSNHISIKRMGSDLVITLKDKVNG